MKIVKFIWVLLLYFVAEINVAQIPINAIPELQQISVREVTTVFITHNFSISDPVLTERLGPALSTTNDFGGVPAAENYDIYFSDADGDLDANGSYITIECRFLGTSGGGGGNIAHLELQFNNGYKISPSILSSYYVAGSNYIPGSELNAVDCNPNTFSTLGNNNATPNTMFLRLTFDFSNIIDEVNFTACQGDGFQYVAGSYTFDESNPSGNAYINTPNGCNRLEIVDITFEPYVDAEFNYTGCSGDQFSITIGNVVFNEQNPTGTAVVPALVGCDTLYEVNLQFEPYIEESFSYTGCTGDGYSITFGTTTFDEQNPTGTAIVAALTGCDTLYTVELFFEPYVDKYFTYTGCSGDGYSITIEGITFDEQNPMGTAVVPALIGCDTLYTVELFFEPYALGTYSYTGCTGDQFSVTIGSVTFNEQNPNGTALVSTPFGCDTLYEVNLQFEPYIEESFSYTGCTGDGYSITFGTTTFDEQNPTGTAIVAALTGCDTLYTVDLFFEPYVDKYFTYTGCSGDGYSITIEGTTFDEQNPMGTAVVPALIGCDTLYTVELFFEPYALGTYSYTGCTGDQFSVTIGSVTFNEQNPNGTALVSTPFGCDTLYEVNLQFEPYIEESFSYTGCTGNGFSVTIGGILFNEQNPMGNAIEPALTGCDTLYTVNLLFEPLVEKTYSYTGCSGDGFSITIGGVVFDESNPIGNAIEPAVIGCDTLYNVELNFLPFVDSDYNYTGCTGDLFSVEIGGTTFDEQNPTGTAFVSNPFGCDTFYNVNLIFEPLNSKSFAYSGCTGDGYSITLGASTFDEQNPTGIALVTSLIGCDTIYDVNLFFAPLENQTFIYNGCSGDGFSITLGGTTFDEQNPTGTALVPAISGCDTLYNVNLIFGSFTSQQFEYFGCVGDQYSTIIGGITFDEQNPTGTAFVPGTVGCDTLYNVNLVFEPLLTESFNYNGCAGDQFSITIGGITFNEQNPTGTAIAQATIGCDTLFDVNLIFAPLPTKFYQNHSCSGSQYEVQFGGITFNEQNPAGTALVAGNNGCDTLVSVNLTFDPYVEKDLNYTSCSGSMFSLTLSGTTFNEQNPSGSALVQTTSGCDTLYHVNLVFSQKLEKNFSHESCSGSGYQITLGGITFDELNQTGSAIVSGNCDTIYNVNLTFIPLPVKTINQTSCKGDDFSINIEGTVFNEQNPTGSVIKKGIFGCDTIFHVDLSFIPQIEKSIDVSTCTGSGYSVTVGNVTFNEFNPMGSVTIPGVNSCDTLYSVSLDFKSHPTRELNYVTCEGDPYSIILGGILFNEQNPSGTAWVQATTGCDTIYSVNLEFKPNARKEFNYSTCEGEPFSVNLGGVVFDEQNPTGEVWVHGLTGCDTLYTVTLIFNPTISKEFSYSSCEGDPYSITFGGIVFNEDNPSGTATVQGIVGCDTLYSINLVFAPKPTKVFSYNGCTGDQYAVVIGNTTFNEQNPTGTALVNSLIGCDTLYNVNLKFEPLPSKTFNYIGCEGDSFNINIGGTLFNEQNPKGNAISNSILGCDTTYFVNLNFEKLPEVLLNYNKCKGDEFELSLGGQTFNEEFPEGQVLVPSTLGCDTIYKVKITYENCQENCSIHYSNIISTQIAGQNQFSIVTSESCTIMATNLFIFDRWGNLVYSGSLGPWDGTINGSKCLDGVYTFVFEYIQDGKRRILKGDITLLN